MSSDATPRPRVAVVDDDPRIRALLEDELLDMEVEPCLCANGYELLAMLEQSPVDLILLDLMMPGLDGIQCLQRLQELAYPGTVLIFTALSDEAKRREALAAGAKDYVLKPDLFAKLPGLINQYARAKRESD
jgi:DNA-binding response OmpR family regulator